MGGEGRKKRRTTKRVHLLEDIIVEILMILPLKSLLRFKCVSKRWRSLISSKPFITRHLKYWSTDPDLSRQHLIVYGRVNPYEIWSWSCDSCPLLSVFDEERLPGYQHLRSMYDESNTFGSCNYPGSLVGGCDDPFHMRILGSCNGLILVSAKGNPHSFIIWNPAIRKANTIPRNPPTQVLEFPLVDRKRMGYEICYCLGYDESTDDYKVVRVSYHTYMRDHSLWISDNHHLSRFDSYVETHIYSSRTCSWKKIESPRRTILRFCNSSGKLVNGRLHWLAFEDNSNLKNYYPLHWDMNQKVVSRDIVCLDLAGEKERFEIMGGPECLSSILHKPKPVLKDLGGNLSLICFTSISEINVWAMMKYGDPQSWAKILTVVDFDQNPTTKTDIPRPMSLWLKKNGEMAMYFGPDVVIYNGKDELRNSPVDIQLVEAIGYVTYVESLVLPFGDQQR